VPLGSACGGSGIGVDEGGQCPAASTTVMFVCFSDIINSSALFRFVPAIDNDNDDDDNADAYHNHNHNTVTNVHVCVSITLFDSCL
jgi:hypothetical protein